VYIRELSNSLAFVWVFSLISAAVVAGIRELLQWTLQWWKAEGDTVSAASNPFAIVHAIQVVLLFAIVGVIARAFVGFLEALVLLPLKIVFHMPTGAADFLITTDNPYIAISVSVRLAIMLLVPFALFRFFAYCESVFGMAISPQIKLIAPLVFYVAAVLATAVYPLLLRIEFRGGPEPFDGHGFGIIRYADSVTSFMLAFGLMCTGCYLCGVAGYLNVSFLNLIRGLWPFLALPFFGLTALVILFQTSSGTAVNWVVLNLSIGSVVLYCILGILTVRVSHKLSRN